MSDELETFLKARLAEEERAARDAGGTIRDWYVPGQGSVAERARMRLLFSAGVADPSRFPIIGE